MTGPGPDLPSDRFPPGYPPSGPPAEPATDPHGTPRVGGDAALPGQFGSIPASQYGQPVAETCAFHPNRTTGLHCTRCGRPACPECLTPASVGFHCRACVAEARGTQRAALTIAGSRVNQQPLVTAALIVVNVVIFVICAIQAKSVMSPENSPIFEQGALSPDLVASGQYWRLLTSGFLHLSLPHIALNMISLYALGYPMERILGRWRFLVVYLLALLGGSVAVLLFAPQVSFAAGASGAIFGLMGALFVTFRRLKINPRQLVGIVVLNLVISFTIPGISWQDHLGGLFIGAAAGAIMVYPPLQKRRDWQVGGSVGLLVVLIVITGIWASLHTAQFCGITNGYYDPCPGASLAEPYR